MPPEARRPATATSSGILRPDQFARHVQLSRPLPHQDLSSWVEHYWTVRWELPAGTLYRSEVASHPAVHATVESGTSPHHGLAMPAALVHGVVTRRFTIDLTGEGRSFGVKFRPGGFGAFTGEDVATWTDRVDKLEAAFGASAVSLQRDVLALEDDTERSRAMDAFLLARVPDPDPRYTRVLHIVAGLVRDSTLTSVDAVCERFDISARTLQRLFRRYVGVGPKWVLQRYRLHDAVSLIDAGDAPDLAMLAADLGWFDQAHFTRDFTELVGVPPREYAAR
ncbi:AraC family transcriptional regulator [Nocardioides sp. Soil797]|nr:AraC family transcriptional regulator [Nocardioides sp. Soil797]